MPAVRTKTDKALAIDCEFTCWDGEPPPGMKPEIIQIGIVEADLRSLEITRKESFLVRPVTSEISVFCTKLTRITQEMVKAKGRHLSEVLSTIANGYGVTKPWVTWGTDWNAIEAACRDSRRPNPFGPELVINLGMVINLFAGEDRRVGLDEAMQIAGVEPEGEPHDALVDAGNLMRLFLRYAAEHRKNTPQPAVEAAATP